MTGRQLEQMEAQLVLHEGLRLEPYECTEGYLTVLVGVNIEVRGWDFISKVLGRKIDPAKPAFTREDALRVLRADIQRIEAVVEKTWPYYLQLSEVRQRVILDLAFNMGGRVLQFRKAKAAAEINQWSNCARELYKSKWATQVDDGQGGRFGRADRLAVMVLTNKEPEDPEWVRFVQTHRGLP